ncbi:unnamed protein product [Linum trigynum]|uniref:Uncharacterized protein n=1 Tax=Linum trigynum TaxID=586398 RepID=A0AAV2FTY1_9ROSI
MLVVLPTDWQSKDGKWIKYIAGNGIKHHHTHIIFTAWLSDTGLEICKSALTSKLNATMAMARPFDQIPRLLRRTSWLAPVPWRLKALINANLISAASDNSINNVDRSIELVRLFIWDLDPCW